MDITMILMYVLPALLSGAGGWFVGKATKRKQKNDILQEMQNSIDLVLTRNKELLNELINLRSEIAQVKSENAALRVEVEELNRKLENVKTITCRK